MADGEGTPGGHKPHERGTVKVNCHYEQAIPPMESISPFFCLDCGL